MTASRRLQRELSDILASDSLDGCRDIKPEEDNILLWTALIVPDHPPFNRAAYRVEFIFSEQYPFYPPKIRLLTKIYHPNVDEKGEICLEIINSDNWKPATRVEQVIQALVKLINEPEPEHPLRADLAEEYVKDRKKFFKNAEDFAKKNGEKRPPSK